MDRKKELKRLYRQTKPRMGVFIVRCDRDKKCFLKETKDLRGVMNGCAVRLSAGIHPCRELQKEWNRLGAGCFTIKILEELPYDADETKTDYSEDLALLRMIWEEKLQKERFSFYGNRL